MDYISTEGHEFYRIPILVIGYCRPIEFKRIAEQIEELPSRKITISLDGPKLGQQLLTDEVLLIANRWKEVSKHKISILRSKMNLGLLTHFTTALKSFFSEHEFGLILEDDMEFRPEFIEYLDTDLARKALLKYWSICGHNPLQKYDLSCKRQSEQIEFFETSIHTIWGWAASKSSIDHFLDIVYTKLSDSTYLFDTVEKFSKSLTIDSIFRHSINENWFRKIRRAVNSEKPNWDNFFVIAGWSSGRCSIMPRYSLSRENPQFFGIQTHKHTTDITSWNSISKFLISNSISQRSRRVDQSLVAVWGNSRLRAYKDFVRQILD